MSKIAQDVQSRSKITNKVKKRLSTIQSETNTRESHQITSLA